MHWRAVIPCPAPCHGDCTRTWLSAVSPAKQISYFCHTADCWEGHSSLGVLDLACQVGGLVCLSLSRLLISVWSKGGFVFCTVHKHKMESLVVWFFSLLTWLKSHLWFLNQRMAWLFLLFCGELNILEFSVLAAGSLKSCGVLFSSYFCHVRFYKLFYKSYIFPGQLNVRVRYAACAAASWGILEKLIKYFRNMQCEFLKACWFWQ